MIETKRRIGTLTFQKEDKSDIISVFGPDGLFVGQVTETQILKLAAKHETTSIRIDSSLRDELRDLIDGNNVSLSDVVRHLKMEHDKAGD